MKITLNCTLMCLEEAYGGGQGTMEITIKKDGAMAGRADIDYVG